MTNINFKLPKNFKVKLMLYNEEPTFAVGVIELLELVKKTGSLNKSCKEMHMAYSKGIRIIRRAEEDLGITLVVGKIGGAGGGGSVLTKEGENFLQFYNQLSSKIDNLVEDLLNDAKNTKLI